MTKQRARLDLDEEEGGINLEELLESGPSRKKVPPTEIVQQVARDSGFVSREAPPPRRRRKRSPYTAQIGIKARPAMRTLFQDLSAHLDVYDHTTFEQALLALIEKRGTGEHKKTFYSIVKTGG